MRALTDTCSVVMLSPAAMRGWIRHAVRSLRRLARWGDLPEPRIRLAEGCAFRRDLARTDDLVGRLRAESRRVV